MPATARKLSGFQQTSVRIPKPIYEEAKKAIAQGVTEATSINDFFVDSVTTKLELLRKNRIDAAFAEMKNDALYQRDTREIEQQFAGSDSEVAEEKGA